MTKRIEKEDRHLVLKSQDITSFLSEEQIGWLVSIIDTIAKARKQKGKQPYNKYIIVNEDEPYSEVIFWIISIATKTPWMIDTMVYKVKSSLGNIESLARTRL